MPTYNYVCKACDKEVELKCKMSEHKNWVNCVCGAKAKQVVVAPKVIIPSHMKAC